MPRQQGFIAINWVIVALAFLWPAARSFAQTEILNFQALHPRKGQNPNVIMDITEDRQGFLWVSTWEGLFRYDGYQFKQYLLDSIPVLQDKPHLKSTGKILAGKDGNIWVFNTYAMGGYDAKLHILDTRQDTFRAFGFSIVASPWNFNETIVEDNAGNCWIRSWDGLRKISTSNKKLSEYTVKLYKHEPGNPYSLKDDTIASLLLDKKGRFWAASSTGLHRYDYGSSQFIPISQLEVRSPINGMCETARGVIAISTWGDGFYLYDPDKQAVTHFLAQPANAQALSGNFIQYMLADARGQIWFIAAESEQRLFILQRFDPVEKKFYRHYLPPIRPIGLLEKLLGEPFYMFADDDGPVWFNDNKNMLHYSMEEDKFKTVEDLGGKSFIWNLCITFFRDKNEVLWMGIAQGGIIKYAPSANQFKIFQHKRHDEKSLSSDLVFTMAEGRNGDLWVATQSAGVDRYLLTPDNSILDVVHYTANAPPSHRIPDDNISGLETDARGYIWVGTPIGSVPIHPVTGEAVSSGYLPPGLEGNGKIEPKDFQWLTTGLNGDYWMITLKGQLIYWDGTARQWHFFTPNPRDPAALFSNRIKAFWVDAQGNAWMVTGQVLQRYERESGKFTRYPMGANNMADAGPGKIWLASNNRGLILLDAASGAVLKHYHKNAGFPSNVAKGILKDDKGRFWIGSDRGLIFFDPVTEKSHLFGQSSGLPTEDFYYPSGCKRANGELAMPLTSGGFILFDPAKVRPDTLPPKTAIVDIKLFNNSLLPNGGGSPLKHPINYTDEIRLAYNQNVITLEYAGLHFADPDANQYAYKMDGVDTSWTEVGNRRYTTYAGLRPGKYTFHVKAANLDNYWGEPAVLSIVISPPWWQTWWAYTLYAASTLGGLFFLYRFQLKRRLEHAETLRLQELDTVKTRLYTNITHEFRTPLTIILGMAKQIRDNPKDWYSEGLQMIERNGKNLLRLVNQMLDLSKLEAGAMPVHLERGDAISFLKYNLESFHSLAEEKMLGLQFHSDYEKIDIAYDFEKLQEIVSNLVSNAIKFTPPGGQVVLRAGFRKQQDFGKLALAVSDTGVGIPPEKLPHIFDRFYQADDEATRHAEGTGIGLALTKELVKLLGGEISVKSEPGKWTVFEVSLPVSGPVALQTANDPARLVNDDVRPHESTPTGQSKSRDENSIRNIQPSISNPILLVVEDNQDVVRYLQSFLSEKYQIEVAQNGRQGIEKAIEIVPDIIISDVMMPEADGFELCGALKKDEHTSHIPIILLTAKADAASRLEGLERGADAYLAKPFDKEEMLVRLRKMVELRKKLQQRYSNAAALPTPSETIEIQIEDAFMKKVREILEAHLGDENFGIPGLCKILNMSRAQLYRKFQALTGQPIMHYFRSLRLHRAKTLLLTTGLHVSEIAFEVGFKDHAHFTRAFSEEFGASPTEMRKK